MTPLSYYHLQTDSFSASTVSTRLRLRFCSPVIRQEHCGFFSRHGRARLCRGIIHACDGRWRRAMLASLSCCLSSQIQYKRDIDSLLPEKGSICRLTRPGVSFCSREHSHYLLTDGRWVCQQVCTTNARWLFGFFSASKYRQAHAQSKSSPCGASCVRRWVRTAEPIASMRCFRYDRNSMTPEASLTQIRIAKCVDALVDDTLSCG